MVVDGSLMEEDTLLLADICVIGAGTAGIAFAREFINTNHKIVVLESGGMKPNSDTAKLTEGENIGNQYDELADTRARAFGGTSHYWNIDIKKEYQGVRIRGLDQIDFMEKDWVPNSGWPISKKDLDPYYDKAHKLFQIGPYTYKFDDWKKSDEFNYFDTNNENVLTTIFQFAKADIFYTDYYKELEKAENITVYLNSTVLNINTTQNSKKVSSLTVVNQDKKKFTCKAANYVLAAGGLENPRLLLLSNKYSEKGLGNQKDLVGRFFMEHPHMWGRGSAGTFYPKNPDLFNENNIFNLHHRRLIPVMGYLKFSDDFIREHQLLNITFGFRGISHKIPSGYLKGYFALRSFLSGIKRIRLNKNLYNNLKIFSKNAKPVIYEGIRKILNGKREAWNRYELVDSGININLMAEQCPNFESRVQLSSEFDYYGQRKIALDWKLSNFDLKSIKKALELLDQQFRKNNLGFIDVNFKIDESSNELKWGYHHMGTTRMHTSQEFGVVDENCKLHGTDNLFIAGSSVFPTSGYANPTLTLAALSIRLADHLKKL